VGTSYSVDTELLRGWAVELRHAGDEFSRVDGRSDFTVADLGVVLLVDRLRSFTSGWEDGRSDLREGMDQTATALDRSAAAYEEAEAAFDGPARSKPAGDQPASGPAASGPAGAVRDALLAGLAATPGRLRDRLATIDHVLTGAPAERMGFQQSELVDLGIERTRLAAILRRLDHPDPAHPYGVLSVESSGEGRIVEVHGNLATAERVVTVVCGMDNDLGDVTVDHGPEARARGIRDAAALYDLLRAKYPDQQIAVVGWMDYDPPDDPRTAGPTALLDLSVDEATRAGGRLAGFVHQLRRCGWNPDQLSLVGHSYGSTVVGQAMTVGVPTANVILLGSPGLGPGIHDRADLGSPDASVWSAMAQDDPVRLLTAWERATGVEFLGTLPSNPEFGAAQLDTEGVTGHSAYLIDEHRHRHRAVAENIAAENIASIVAGHGPVRTTE